VQSPVAVQGAQLLFVQIWPVAAQLGAVPLSDRQLPWMHVFGVPAMHKYPAP
jgi:hypothetical protein